MTTLEAPPREARRADVDPVDDRVVRRRLGPGRRIPMGYVVGPLTLLEGEARVH